MNTRGERNRYLMNTFFTFQANRSDVCLYNDVLRWRIPDRPFGTIR